MKGSLQIRLIYAGSALLAALLAWVLILKTSYTVFASLGLALFAAGALLAFTGYRPAYKALLFLIPLSIEMPFGIGDSKIIFPSEAFIILLSISFVFLLLFRMENRSAFLKHPLTLIVLLYCLLMIISSLNSSMPIISLKYSLVNLAYIFIFYFLLFDFINEKKSSRPLRQFFLLYALPFGFVIAYSIYRHYLLGFGRGTSLQVMQPFYSDHGIYSACLAMLLPAFLAFSLRGRLLGLSQSLRILSIVLMLAIAIGLFLSYSRAAWLSVLAAGGVYFLLRLKIKPPVLLTGLLLIGSIGWFYNDKLIEDFKENKNNSTEQNVSLEEQAKSVTNISSDISNAERLNRWSCAWRMFLDRPVTGYGPGTYQFEYLPYQRYDEMTRISVTSAYNNEFGRGGSAHSEYLLALSEMGIIGFILFFGLFLATIFIGIRIYRQARREKDRIWVAIAVASLSTYFIHAFFNNYLNSDKAASLFWGCLCILAFMDIRIRKQLNPATNA